MEQRQRVWDIVEATGVGMLTTQFPRGLRARPLEARPDRDHGVIYFIIDARGLKDDEIALWPEVCFSMINDADKAYLSLSGRAETLTDRVLAARVWKNTDDVWWPDGPSDRYVRVLKFAPHLAELWDGPAGAAVARHELARARETGEAPDLGENRKVSVEL